VATNLEIVQTVLKGWSEGDMSLDAFDDDIEWDAAVFPDGAVEHGHEGIRRFLRRWLGTWEEYRFEVEQVFDAGDRVLAFVRERGYGRGSDVPMDIRTAMLFTLRGGKIVRFRGSLDHSAALAEAGLSGDAQELADSGSM
jgi:ketosteroid isomerase-like protein